jgi:hypothetical protein
MNKTSTSYFPSPGSLVQSLHVPLLAHIQWGVNKNLKEGQTGGLVDLPGVEAVLEDRMTWDN